MNVTEINTIDNMKLHEQIKKEREEQVISKYKLSRIIKTNESYYGTIENGKHSPSLDMMKRICAALNVSITIHPDGKTELKSKV